MLTVSFSVSSKCLSVFHLISFLEEKQNYISLNWSVKASLDTFLNCTFYSWPYGSRDASMQYSVLFIPVGLKYCNIFNLNCYEVMPKYLCSPMDELE